MSLSTMTILLGCDSISRLTYLLKCLNGLKDRHYRIVHASRIGDIKQLSKNIDCQLCLLCYKNNQEALSYLGCLADREHIPLLCISDAGKQQVERGEKQIVFTCTYDDLNIPTFLASMINSIVLLQAALPPLDEEGKNCLYGKKHNLELEHKVNTLLSVKAHLERMLSQSGRHRHDGLPFVVSLIKRALGSNDTWKDMDAMFDQTNPEYVCTLANKHPGLTSIDLKYCCYIKMNLSNDDIRNILGINQESVRTHKYRLKKKLKLRRSEELSNYLHTLNRQPR